MGIAPPQGLLATSVAVDAVDTAAIQDDAVTAAKLSAGAAGTVKISDSAVTTGKLADAAVTNRKLSGGAVDSAVIAPSAVGEGRLTDAGVSPRKVQSNGEYTVGRLSAAGVSAGRVSAGAMDLGGTTDHGDNPTIGLRSSPSAVVAADLSVGEMIFDEASGGVAFKTNAGSAWFAHASSLA